MKNESGIESGGRNFGRLALALIPWAIGVGAATWLGVWIGAHNFHHQLTQEERAAVYTGAQERPTAKVKVHVIAHDCAVVTRADVDGTDLLVYARNGCHERLRYFAWHWQLVSPNGTVVAENYENSCPIPREPKQEAECHLTIKDDDRAETLKVWVAKDTE